MAKRMRRTARWGGTLPLLLLLVHTAAGPAKLHAQAPAETSASTSAVLDSLVRAHSRPLRLADRRLQGEGAEWLIDRAAGAQFVGLGEEHNRRQMPELAGALFRALQERHGFQFLATEQDPATMRRLSEHPVRGNPDSVTAMARRYPHAFSFISDQELEMLTEVGRASRARERPIWGVDHSTGATHALDRLLSGPLPDEARSLARALRDSAHAHERVRDLARLGLYLGNPPQAPHRTATLRRLAEAVEAAPGSEAETLIRSLVIADSVFRLFHEGEFYENSRVREEYMKERFVGEYRRAAAHEPRPRVLLKLGHWHLFRGLGPNNTQTLGNFASEFATANGMEAFLVAAAGHPGEAGGGDVPDPLVRAYRMLGRATPADAWTIVDLRPLRPVFARLGRDLPPETRDALRRYVFGFDALLVIGGLEPATFVRTGVPF